jgi:hypothetical protein
MDQTPKQPVLKHVNPTLTFVCHDILGLEADSRKFVAVLREAGIIDFDLDQLA